jgi:hypothetical protein
VERGLIISPPLTGGDKGEGDTCGFTNAALVKGRFTLTYLSFLLPCHKKKIMIERIKNNFIIP